MTKSHFVGPLAADFADFVAALEAAGSANQTTLRRLRALDRFTKENPLSSKTIDEAVARAWLAPCAARGPRTRRSRYCLLRRFCRFLATRRAGTFVPDESLRPPVPPPPHPHIYRPEEIRLLLDGALLLRDWEKGHFCPIRSKTIHTLILLLATTGLRISEALSLTLQDVDLDEGVLSIRHAKFHKTRLVPVSQGTLTLLRRYQDLRLTVVPNNPSVAFFISGRGKAYSTVYVQTVFRRLAVAAGLHPPTGRGPGLHSLRHTFAVTRLLQWYREGDNVMARLPLLSTYLGHVSVRGTETYLQATTTLLQEANGRFHAFAKELFSTGGRS